MPARHAHDGVGVDLRRRGAPTRRGGADGDGARGRRSRSRSCTTSARPPRRGARQRDAQAIGVARAPVLASRTRPGRAIDRRRAVRARRATSAGACTRRRRSPGRRARPPAPRRGAGRAARARRPRACRACSRRRSGRTPAATRQVPSASAVARRRPRRRRGRQRDVPERAPRPVADAATRPGTRRPARAAAARDAPRSAIRRQREGASGRCRRRLLVDPRGDGYAHAPVVARPARCPNPAPSPRKVCRAGSRRAGLLARGSSSPGPFPPCGSGCDRVRPPLQLRGSEGFAPSSLHPPGVATVIRLVAQGCQLASTLGSESPRDRSVERSARAAGSRARRASGRR